MTKYELSTPYSFQDTAQTRIARVPPSQTAWVVKMYAFSTSLYDDKKSLYSVVVTKSLLTSVAVGSKLVLIKMGRLIVNIINST